ncbi:MAG: hypothetical protein ACP5RM_00805 [Candidatus Micrarchaeia archaeon]
MAILFKTAVPFESDEHSITTISFARSKINDKPDAIISFPASETLSRMPVTSSLFSNVVVGVMFTSDTRAISKVFELKYCENYLGTYEARHPKKIIDMFLPSKWHIAGNIIEVLEDQSLVALPVEITGEYIANKQVEMKEIPTLKPELMLRKK